MEVETVRQMWSEEVNRQLEAAQSPERVDHRSLAAQRAEALEHAGLSVHGLNLVPNNGNVRLAVLAQQLDLYVGANFTTDQAIDMMGFSMGGLVSRYYRQRLGGIHRVCKFVTIARPTTVAPGPHSCAPILHCETCDP